MPAKKKTVTLQQVYEKLLEHDQRFEKVYGKLTEHDQQFSRVINHILDLESSLKKEIDRLDKRIDALLGSFDKFTNDLETLNQEYHLIVGSLRRIEQILGTPEQWPQSIRIEIDAIKNRLSSVEAHISGRNKLS